MICWPSAKLSSLVRYTNTGGASVPLTCIRSGVVAMVSARPGLGDGVGAGWGLRTFFSGGTPIYLIDHISNFYKKLKLSLT